MSQEIGDFFFKAVTFIVKPGLAGTVEMLTTFEGTASGFGMTLGTMTVNFCGPEDGRWSWCAINYPESGPIVSGTAQGTYSGRGPRNWHTRGLLTCSDGRICRVDGEFDLLARTWIGRLLPRE